MGRGLDLSQVVNTLWAVLAIISMAVPVFWRMFKRSIRIEELLNKEFGNGGESTKDHASAAAVASGELLSRFSGVETQMGRLETKLELSQQANLRDLAAQGEVLRMLQHDLRNVGTRTDLLGQAVDRMRTDRVADKAAWIAALAAQGIKAPTDGDS